MLLALWGQPVTQATIVPADDLADTLWKLQEENDETSLTILPFHRLRPQMKVLRLDGRRVSGGEPQLARPEVCGSCGGTD